MLAKFGRTAESGTASWLQPVAGNGSEYRLNVVGINTRMIFDKGSCSRRGNQRLGAARRQADFNVSRLASLSDQRLDIVN
jgi:hypothetical protein